MRKLLCIVISGTLAVLTASGQDLRIPRFSVQQLVESETAAAVLRESLPADPQQQPQQQQTPTSPAPKKAGRSSKKKWIIIAAVAGGAAITLWAVNKRLSNEGSGIFGR